MLKNTENNSAYIRVYLSLSLAFIHNLDRNRHISSVTQVFKQDSQETYSTSPPSGTSRLHVYSCKWDFIFLNMIKSYTNTFDSKISILMSKIFTMFIASHIVFSTQFDKLLCWLWDICSLLAPGLLKKIKPICVFDRFIYTTMVLCSCFSSVLETLNMSSLN